MNRHEDQELWDLLGKSPAPQIRGNFADHVLREIRLSSEGKSSFPAWLRWAFAPVAAGVVALLTVNFQPGPSQNQIPASDLALITETAGQLALNDLDDVAHLDDLLQDDENTVWLGTASF